MENIVNVEGTELDVREYNGQMVVTFDDIDLVHKRPSGTARKAFNRNKKRFINGVDYIVLEKENSNVHRVDIRNIDIPNRGITNKVHRNSCFCSQTPARLLRSVR